MHTLPFVLVHHAAWEERRDDWTQTLLAPVLAHPSCRFLRELEIDASPGDDALRFLSASPPKLLEGLTLTCNELDLAHLGAGLSQLVKLNLSAQLIVPAAVHPQRGRGISLPRLGELSLPADAMTIDGLGIVLSALPSVRRLTLSSLESFDARALFPVVQLRALESLTLLAERTTLSAVEAIIESPLRETLRTLDFSRSGVTAEAAQKLLAWAPEKFARLDSLHLGHRV